LNASSALAAPQADIKNLRRLTPKRFAFWLAVSCARRLPARLAGESGTGANSPFEVVSNLIGSRSPSGSILCFMVMNIDHEMTHGEALGLSNLDGVTIGLSKEMFCRGILRSNRRRETLSHFASSETRRSRLNISLLRVCCYRFTFYLFGSFRRFYFHCGKPQLPCQSRA
jgi:hypothetical protein